MDDSRIAAKFAACVSTPGPLDTPCLIWPFHKEKGYGRVWFRNRDCGAHRVSYELATGDDPAGLCVCHRCDNPSCVNPGHLFKGTIADNNADMKSKGRCAKGERTGAYTHPERHPRGESHHAAKLSAADVIDIRTARKSGIDTMTLARRYGVHKTTIARACDGRRWNHIVTQSAGGGA